MDKFCFYNPVRVIFGAGELKQLATEVRAFGKKALLVSYKDHDFMRPTIDRVISLCKEGGVEVVPFFEVVANPTIDGVRAAVSLAIQEKVDFIIALGGGSAMDTAKIAAAGVLYPHDPWMMINARHNGESAAIAPTEALPLVMIPTIPATSSEMNCGAVVQDPETHEKSYLFAACIYPKLSILDPELTLSLPAYQTAAGGVDAISHAAEVYFNGVPDTPLQDSLVEGIMRTLVGHIPQALANPQDIVVRSHIMWEACVAWNGWTLPGTSAGTPMHMVAHALSARYGMAHGVTLGIAMLAFYKYTWKDWPERFIQFGERVMGLNLTGLSQEEACLKAIDAFEQFLTQVGVETRMSQYKGAIIPSSDIDMLVDDCERVYFGADKTLYAHRPLTREDVKAILKLMY